MQSYERDEGRPPQLTHTDPSRTADPRQSRAPAEPKRNHKRRAEPAAEPERNRTASRQDPEPAAATTTRKPTPGHHTARAVERPGKWNTVAKTHFQSDLSNLVGWHVAVSPCHAISHNINTILLQCTPNLFNLLLIHSTNANAAINLAVTILNNFELK